jgi:hypothetical protein
MMKKSLILALTLPLFMAFSVQADHHKKGEKNTEAAAEAPEQSESPKGAKAYIVQPKDGKTAKTKFKVIFGLKGMGVAPAGIKFPNTGHHHLLIDASEKDYDFTKPLPASDNCKHFGGGQTETMLELAPGKHTLQLVLGDHLHIPHNPPVVSEKITITVE